MAREGIRTLTIEHFYTHIVRFECNLKFVHRSSKTFTYIYYEKLVYYVNGHLKHTRSMKNDPTEYQDLLIMWQIACLSNNIIIK